MCLNLVYAVINLVYMVINFYIVFINQTMSKSKHWNGITTDNPLGSAHFEDQSVAVLLRFETCGSTTCPKASLNGTFANHVVEEVSHMP